MRKYILIFSIFIFSACSSIESDQVMEEAFLDFPQSFDSLFETFREDEVFFLNNVVENSDTMTQFYCAQFFRSVEIENIEKISDTSFIVKDVDGKEYTIDIIVENYKITYFRAEEVLV